jgi:hypothetical protein
MKAAFRWTTDSLTRGPLRFVLGWPVLAFLILKHKIDSHYYELMSDVEKRDAIVRWADATNCRLVVETGTFMGWTAGYLGKCIERVITIELDHQLAVDAREKFREMPNVQVIEGNSGEVLSALVPSIKERALFYLDAHYCGESTARFEGNTPIMTEIQTILDSSHDHVILIDDARMYLGIDGYPSIRALRRFVQRLAPHYELRVADDLIKIFNPRCHDHAQPWLAR